MRIKHLLYTLPLAAAALLSYPVHGEAQHRALVVSQLDAVERRGYRRTHDDYIRSMRQGESHTIWLTLNRNVAYTIFGFCDRDCNDLDLELYDENDNLIDYDYAYDDYPIVAVTPSWTSTFRVRVTMPGCSINPCFWGVGVYRNR